MENASSSMLMKREVMMRLKLSRPFLESDSDGTDLLPLPIQLDNQEAYDWLEETESDEGGLVSGLPEQAFHHRLQALFLEAFDRGIKQPLQKKYCSNTRTRQSVQDFVGR